MARDFNENRNVNARLVVATIDTLGTTFAVQNPYKADGFSKVIVNPPQAPTDITKFLEGDNLITTYPVASNVSKLCDYALASFPSITTIYLFNDEMVTLDDDLSYLTSLDSIYVPSDLVDTYKSTNSSIASKFKIIIDQYTVEIEYFSGTSTTLTTQEVDRQLGMLSDNQVSALQKLVISDDYTFESASDIAWNYDFSDYISLDNNIWYGDDYKFDFSVLSIIGDSTTALTSVDIDNAIANVPLFKRTAITQVKISGYTNYDVALEYNYEDLPNLEYVWLDNVRYDINNLPRLPIGYQEVEYIESSGTQALMLPNINIDYWFIDCCFLNTNSSQTILGAYVFNNPGRFGLSCDSSYTNYALWTGGSGYEQSNVSALTRADIEYDYNNHSWKINNVQYSTTTIEKPIDMFRYNVSDYSTAKVYRYYSKYNNEIVLDLRPCYRESDNEIGMYDLVNNVFYTNVGTGTFLKGSSIGVPTYFYPISDLVSEYDANEEQTFYLDYNGTFPTIAPNYLLTWYEDENCTTTIIPENMVAGNRYYAKCNGTIGVDFANETWGQIKTALDGGFAQYQLGDTKTITYDNATYTIRICDIGARYDLSSGNGKNKATFEFVECVGKGNVNNSLTNSGGWALSYMKTTTMPSIYNNLPSDLKAVISQVIISSASDGSANGSGSLSYSDNYLFLASVYEIAGSRGNSNEIEETTQYEYYIIHNTRDDRVKLLADESSPNGWYNRSPCAGNTGYFCIVNAAGNLVAFNASDNRGIAPFFCI